MTTTHAEYILSRHLAHGVPGVPGVTFAALIMAAMRRADSDNMEMLKDCWPHMAQELQARYNASGGLLPGEPPPGAPPAPDFTQDEPRWDSANGLPVANSDDESGHCDYCGDTVVTPYKGQWRCRCCGEEASTDTPFPQQATPAAE